MTSTPLIVRAASQAVHCPTVIFDSDLESAPEPDEITGRADMLVGHSCCLRAAERFVNMPQISAVNDFADDNLYVAAMQPDYSAIVHQLASAVPYIIAILVFVLALNVLEQRFPGRRRRWRGRSRSSWQGSRDSRAWFEPRHDAVVGRVPDAADQLRTVMKADFKAQPLVNKSEARLFRAIDKMVIEMRPGWQVMAQVSLGEILKCEDKAAYACINSKRVDLLIVDDECRPLHAIEYQGGAHFKGAHATAARDAVKKEALRRAGIGYVEVVAGDTPAELRRVVERLVQRN